jgi:hypothetical protein
MRFRVNRVDEYTSTPLLNLVRLHSDFDVIMRLASGNMADDNVALKTTEAARA